MGTSHERLWAHAATFGATWGAVEITVGSFLHALRIPFAGLLLGAVGAGLLLTLRTVFPRRGALLAAGAVCAGVKLLSPAGAVVGPALAILVEAALVEAVCLPAGARRSSALVAGAMCTLWSLTQKLITQALFFGMPVLGIYLGVLERAEKWLRLPPNGGLGVAATLLAVVMLLGALCGLAGHRIGLAARPHLRRSAA
jgi:hypothetical protein